MRLNGFAARALHTFGVINWSLAKISGLSPSFLIAAHTTTAPFGTSRSVSVPDQVERRNRAPNDRHAVTCHGHSDKDADVPCVAEEQDATERC